MPKVNLIIIFLLTLFLPSCNWFSKEEPLKTEPTIEFKVKFLDENKNPISVNYSLEIYNNISNQFMPSKSGVSGNTYTILSSNAQINKVYQLTYVDSDHYPKKEIIRTSYSNYLNTFSFNPEYRKGKIDITFVGGLELDKENQIILNISSTNGSIKRISVCFDYSLKIIYAKPKNDFILCDYYWVNYSIYPHNNSKFDLPSGEYKCLSDDYIEKCNRVEYNKCFSEEMKIPESLRKKSIKCFNIGKTITDYYELPILIKTMPLMMEGDYLTVYLLDQYQNIFKFRKLW